MKSHFRVFAGVFVFFVFGDSGPLRGQNSPVQSVPEYICEPMKDFDPAMCLSGGDGNPQGPLASRIPVILIHGWNPKNVPGEPDIAVWRGLASHLYENRWFREKYKMYFLVYLSNVQGIRDMGLTFMSLIDRMDEVDPDFRGKPLVIIGYSMGGLIARSYMQEPRFGSGGLGGDRVLRLITLGTPHHGSPFANGPARDHKAGFWAELLHQFVDGSLFGFDVRWYMDNRFDLHWDNYDSLFDYESYSENNLWLERLNSGNTFERKIVAYGGMVSPLTQIDDCVFSGFRDAGCLSLLMKQSLDVAESDGVVPLASALFYPCKGCLATRIYPGYDHNEIVSGKFNDLFPFPFPNENDPLFWDISGNLLSLIVPEAPRFDNYADLGNSEDERFHALSGWGRVNPGLLPRSDTDLTSRYQSLRGYSSADLFVTQTLTPYRLTFRSEDGHCDDSFDVYVNGRLVYIYNHRGPPTDFPIHSISIPAELVISSRVRVMFLNRSRDNCGLAAVYYVRLDPV